MVSAFSAISTNLGDSTDSEDLEMKWGHLRSSSFHPEAHSVVLDSAPTEIEVVSATHMRSAHYAVYRVDDNDGNSWVVRIGAVSDEDDDVPNNSGYLGTSVVIPTGQKREHTIASSLHQAGGSVCLPRHYARTAEGYDALWLPFLNGVNAPVTAEQWHHALTSLYTHKPDGEMPVFTNRAKTFARLDDLTGIDSEALRQTYDEQLFVLFQVATKWSVVHGDAHSGNAINTGTTVTLYDFDTACWAPSVWDLTHLLNRAGKGENTGYLVDELKNQFQFSDAEIKAALKLRRTAALVAKLHREQP